MKGRFSLLFITIKQYVLKEKLKDKVLRTLFSSDFQLNLSPGMLLQSSIAKVPYEMPVFKFRIEQIHEIIFEKKARICLQFHAESIW